MATVRKPTWSIEFDPPRGLKRRVVPWVGFGRIRSGFGIDFPVSEARVRERRFTGDPFPFKNCIRRSASYPVLCPASGRGRAEKRTADAWRLRVCDRLPPPHRGYPGQRQQLRRLRRQAHRMSPINTTILASPCQAHARYRGYRGTEAQFSRRKRRMDKCETWDLFTKGRIAWNKWVRELL